MTSTENIEKLAKQVKEQMEKSFQDLISQKYAEKSDFAPWMRSLLGEIKDRIIKVASVSFGKPLSEKKKTLVREIDEAIDLDIIERMFIHDAIGPENLGGLVKTIFYYIDSLGTPHRSASVKEKMDKLLSMCQDEGVEDGTVASSLIMFSNSCLDDLEQDYDYFVKMMREKGRVPTKARDE